MPLRPLCCKGQVTLHSTPQVGGAAPSADRLRHLVATLGDAAAGVELDESDDYLGLWLRLVALMYNHTQLQPQNHLCVFVCARAKWFRSCPTLYDLTLWIVIRQAPLSMEFSRQEHWNGLPCPPPDLPDSGIKTASHYVSCIGRQILYH